MLAFLPSAASTAFRASSRSQSEPANAMPPFGMLGPAIGGDAMPKVLSSSAPSMPIAATATTFRCLPSPPREVAHYRGCLETHEAKTGAPLQGNWRHKAHLLFTWVDELVHHPKIVDAAEDVLGPDLLCWTTNFFIKEANSPGFVSWHQDAFYWGLSKDDVMTAWVALSPANLESGCMKFLPGSQTQDHLQHVDTFHKDNLLSRGQEIAVKVDEREDGRLHSRARRDVAASRQAGAWLGAQPLQRPAHRPGDPLHPDRRQAAEGAGFGHARARRRPLRQLRSRAASQSAISTRPRSPPMPTPSAGR